MSSIIGKKYGTSLFGINNIWIHIPMLSIVWLKNTIQQLCAKSSISQVGICKY